MAQTKKTLVLGASGNPARYSYLAIHKLRSHGHPVEGIGLREVRVSDIEVRNDKLEGTYKHKPERSELSTEINESLIVELYSK